MYIQIYSDIFGYTIYTHPNRPMYEVYVLKYLSIFNFYTNNICIHIHIHVHLYIYKLIHIVSNIDGLKDRKTDR